MRYFKTGLTNARIEEINRKWKLLQRCAMVFKSLITIDFEHSTVVVRTSSGGPSRG